MTPEELRARLAAIRTESNRLTAEVANLDARRDQMDAAGYEERRGRLNAGIANLDRERGEIEAEIGRHAIRADELRAAAADPANREAGAAFPTPARRLAPARAGVTARDEALRAIERLGQAGELRAEAGDRLEHHLREQDPLGWDAEYLRAVAGPAYSSAFGKILADPLHGHLRHSPDEARAMQNVAAAEQTRALASGTGAAGGFAIPFTLDPSIMLTSDGALNPIRTVARVITIGTREWKGVSSAGVTASYDAEGAEVSDDTPTLAQPGIVTAMGRAFVPFSMEVGDDWPGMQQEVAGLIADARDQLDATKFLIGSGADEPAGVLTGLSNTQRVQTAGVAAYSVADGWALKAAIQPRYQANASFAASSPSWDLTYRLIGTDSSEPVQFDNGRGGGFLGRPKIEWSTMATGGPTTGAKLIIAGDFRAGFMIADRLGMSMELVPHLFGGSGRPTGQRGFFARWRTGSKVLIPNALRYLEVK